MTRETIELMFREFASENYPLLQMPEDAEEVDYYQMIEFAEWLVNKISFNLPVMRSEKKYCDECKSNADCESAGQCLMNEE